MTVLELEPIAPRTPRPTAGSSPIPTGTTSVLGVWAHPDDETYLAAGLMLRALDAGAAVQCVVATLGERGTPDPGAWPPARLATTRRAELRDALAIVGAGDHFVLGYADGACADVPDGVAAAVVQSHIERVQPDLIVTFGPDGITGHADHRAVHRWTTLACTRLGITDRLLYTTVTPQWVRRHTDLHAAHPVFEPGYPVACVPDDVAFEIVLDDADLARKRAALAAHASQTEPLARAMGEATYRHWWDTETFRRPRVAELRPALD